MVLLFSGYPTPSPFIPHFPLPGIPLKKGRFLASEPFLTAKRAEGLVIVIVVVVVVVVNKTLVWGISKMGQLSRIAQKDS